MGVFNRDCLSIIEDDKGLTTVLVVSSDEDRERFRSDLLEYRDFSGEPTTVLAEDIWLSCMWKAKSGRHFACEVLGTVYWQDGGAFRNEKLSNDQLFRIWGLSERAVFTVGAAGRCFGFDGEAWQDMSVGLKGYLHAIHGLAPDRLVVAGDTGFVAFWDGQSWDALDLSLSFNFRSARMVRSGETYLCGLNGACIRLRDGELTVIEGTNTSLYSIAEFQGRLYFGSAEGGVFVLESDALVPFKVKARGYDMYASDTQLWTCGASQVACFDGIKWNARSYS